MIPRSCILNFLQNLAMIGVPGSHNEWSMTDSNKISKNHLYVNYVEYMKKHHPNMVHASENQFASWIRNTDIMELEATTTYSTVDGYCHAYKMPSGNDIKKAMEEKHVWDPSQTPDRLYYIP